MAPKPIPSVITNVNADATADCRCEQTLTVNQAIPQRERSSL